MIALIDEDGWLVRVLDPTGEVLEGRLQAPVLPPDDFLERRYRWTGAEWLPDLDQLRAETWTRLKAARDAAEWAGADTALGRVGTDPDSQRKTSGAVQLAQIALAAGEPFAIVWTMQDNSEVAHDAAAMIGMGVAVGRHVAACHAIGAALRAQLAAATTPAEIEEVRWPAA